MVHPGTVEATKCGKKTASDKAGANGYVYIKYIYIYIRLSPEKEIHTTFTAF
jgi:hypothetical protein